MNHARFAIDETLPLSQQKLELACTGAGGGGVRWFVNGQELAASAPGRVYWRVAKGDWRIRAQGGGQTAEVEITVER